MEHPKFVIQKSGPQFYFYLTAPSGEIILHSEIHKRRGTVEEGIAAVKSHATHDLRYDRRTSSTGRHYFVLTANNGEVIGTSEMYSSEGATEKAIDAVKHNAPRAGVE
jgi:uncharacterized protein